MNSIALFLKQLYRQSLRRNRCGGAGLPKCGRVKRKDKVVNYDVRLGTVNNVRNVLIGGSFGENIKLSWVYKGCRLNNGDRYYHSGLGRSHEHGNSAGDHCNGNINLGFGGRTGGKQVRNFHSGRAKRALVGWESLMERYIDERKYPEKYIGAMPGLIPELEESIGGFNRGELTVVTGGTGAGKTSFMCQLALLCLFRTNCRVVFASCEMTNHSLFRVLGTQAEALLSHGIDPNFKANAAPFNEKNFRANVSLPFAQLVPPWKLQFGKDYGRAKPEVIIKDFESFSIAGEFIHKKSNREKLWKDTDGAIDIFFVDNLQYITGGSASIGALGMLEAQDQAVTALRQFANEHECHIVLCAHKNKGGSETVDQLYGSVRISQEADNVISIERMKGGKRAMSLNEEYGVPPPGVNRCVARVLKNRSWGNTNSYDYYFYQHQKVISTKLIEERTDPEVEIPSKRRVESFQYEENQEPEHIRVMDKEVREAMRQRNRQKKKGECDKDVIVGAKGPKKKETKNPTQDSVT
eukprot:Nk52_evm33s96 gene=Nk52_evmTU33s96